MWKFCPALIGDFIIVEKFMSKHWRKKLKKKSPMDEVKSVTAGKPMVKAIEEEKVIPDAFRPREYKPRFVKAEGYKLPEDSKVHCADGRVLEGQAGDFYVCLDQVHEFTLTAETFKKIFILKVEE